MKISRLSAVNVRPQQPAAYDSIPTSEWLVEDHHTAGITFTNTIDVFNEAEQAVVSVTIT